MEAVCGGKRDTLTREEILDWLRETDSERLQILWSAADAVRRANVGEEVHLRGLIEFSNTCVRGCAYCGLRAGNSAVRRYRMSADAIVACAHQACSFGYGTVVLQSGEDPGYSVEAVAHIVRRIKRETSVAVTLSVGERSDSDLIAWRLAGADRYLLRFETSNPRLYHAIHPDLPGMPSDRIAMLCRLRAIGYEVGSGVMVGIPGQTYEDLARDVETFAALDLDMIGIGPYLPHPATPLGRGEASQPAPADRQVPNTELMTYKAVALTRLLCPMANIPSTTALATVNRARGRELGLRRGANVVMPNITPVEFRKEYQIYPGKACLMEDASSCNGCMTHRIHSIGRVVGAGRGDSRNRIRRNMEEAIAL
jgi:biotin synthase